jgi:hypothetical protein
MNSFDRAQRQYDNMTPDNGCDHEKDCPTCDTAGEILHPEPTLWMKVKAFFGIETFILCPECDGHGFVPMTQDDIWDRAAEKADRLRDEEIDRKMGI